LFLRGVALLGAACLLACHAPIRDWRDLARRSGCTPELLAEAPRYQPARVTELAGRYDLIQVDTAAGWIDYEREIGEAGKHDVLTLWAPDSVHRWFRTYTWGKQRRTVPADVPIMGQLASYEHASFELPGHGRVGFDADHPQVEITGPGYNTLVVTFFPYPVNDGQLWELPIERRGQWGFGGYFIERELVVPIGANGKALNHRAGYYCAFRRG